MEQTRGAWEQARQAEQRLWRACFEQDLDRDAGMGAARRSALQQHALQARRYADALAEQTLERLQALAAVEPAAARELADVLWDLLSASEARGEGERAARYASLLERHDDGRYVDLIEGTATLEVRSDPPGARATLERVDGSPAAVCELGTTPVAPLDLEPGDYLLTVEAPHRVRARRRVHVDRGTDIQLLVCLFDARDVGPDAFYLPAGRHPLVADSEAPCPVVSEPIFVDNLAVGRRPVTVGDYLLFLDALAEREPERALRYVPSSMRADLDRDAPVRGVCFDAARRYARWLGERTGRSYRLPNEAEWEKAACAPGSGTTLGQAPEWVVALDPSTRPLLRGGEHPVRRRRHDAETAPPDAVFRLVCELAPGGGERVSAARIPEPPEAKVAA